MRKRAYAIPSNIPQIVRVLQITGGVETRKLIDWLVWEVDKHEDLEVYEWSRDRWYICVVDTKLPSVLNQGRNVIGFTVDLREDKILWSNAGGNCFVYTEKWARRVKKKYKVTFGRTTYKPDTERQVRDYRPRKTG